MVKNIIIVVLVIAAIAEGYFLYQSYSAIKQQQIAMTQSAQKKNLPPAGPNARGGRPIILSKGMNLKTTPVFKYAYQIAPGSLSDAATKALMGWNIATQKLANGSIIVTLTPKDADDQNQQYTIKEGETLYFIEQTPVDDKANQDKDLNYRDDYGVITNASGVIQ